MCETSGSTLPVGVPLNCTASGNDGQNTNSYTRFFSNGGPESIIRMATASRDFTNRNIEVKLAPFSGADCN